ncbi:MAG TPA: type II CAAX endopeptidase family protein [Blastocatellia bacterium]|nr:type II CAAX endopeptidase family protein [Blastocatellia bacterium]
MVDQLAPVDTCRGCGVALNSGQPHVDGLCAECAAARPPAFETAGAYPESDNTFGVPSSGVPASLSPDAPIDPDNPSWGPVGGVMVWILSVGAIIVIPVIAVIVWYFVESARGSHLPNLVNRDEMLEWLKSPNLLLVQVLSTIVAHALTIAFCWAVVTRAGKRPFWESLGWSWAGHSVWYWLLFSAAIIVGLVMATQVLSRFLPQSEENSFTDLLKSSMRVRVAIAVLATFTAPLVEETVYRGVLFSSLRRSLGLVGTVVLVTLMFAGVHVLQYLGAWVTIAGLTLLSLALTLIRARTKSILPCVLIHTVNNAFFAVLILFNKVS